MPLEIVKSVVDKCKDGNLPGWMKNLKKENGYSCTQLGEAVAAMVDNTAKSGSAGDEEDCEGEAYYAQEGEAGDIAGDWIRVIDPVTRIREKKSNRRYSIHETAHAKALEQWKGKEIKGYINHDKTKELGIRVDDVRYDWGSGLYLKMKLDDDFLHDRFKNGLIKPSIEISWNKADEDNDVVMYYEPFGIGLMADGKQLSPTAGPAVPDANSLGLGGETVTDEKKIEGEPEANKPEVKEQPKTEVKQPETKDKSEIDVIKEELMKYKKERDELISKLEKLDLTEKKKDELEGIVRDEYISKMPDWYKHEGKSLDKLKEDYEMIMNMKELYDKGIPKYGVPPSKKPPETHADFEENGKPTKGWFDKVDKIFKGGNKTRKNYIRDMNTLK